MTDVASATGTRRHFSSEDEEALRHDESTNAIVRRDTKIGVDVHGVDRTWRSVKAHQQGEFDVMGAGSVLHALSEGDHLVHGAEGVGAMVGVEVAAGSVAALALGTYEWLDAQAKGKDQNAALARDQAHVAVIGALDLPAGYKAQRFAKDFCDVPRGDQSASFKMTESLMADKTGLAKLQLQCDRGMNAARDLSQSGKSVAEFLKANPKVANTYAKDAAFREGFDAYLQTKATLSPTEVKKMDEKLEQRDGWYAQSQIAIRV